MIDVPILPSLERTVPYPFTPAMQADVLLARAEEQAEEHVAHISALAEIVKAAAQ